MKASKPVIAIRIATFLALFAIVPAAIMGATEFLIGCLAVVFIGAELGRNQRLTKP